MQLKDGGKIFTPQESTEMLQYIATSMATGLEHLGTELHEFRVEVGKKFKEVEENMKAHTNKRVTESEQRTMNYTDKRMTEAENKFILPLRKEDEKVDEVISSAEQRKLFVRTEAERLKNLGPFPKLSLV